MDAFLRNALANQELIQVCPYDDLDAIEVGRVRRIGERSFSLASIDSYARDDGLIRIRFDQVQYVASGDDYLLGLSRLPGMAEVREINHIGEDEIRRAIGEFPAVKVTLRNDESYTGLVRHFDEVFVSLEALDEAGHSEGLYVFRLSAIGSVTAPCADTSRRQLLYEFERSALAPLRGAGVAEP